MTCQARLTDWENTRIKLGSSWVSFARLCEGKARKNENLCEACIYRVSKGCPFTQSRMIHGLLAEEPPKDSLVYGSKGYWKLAEEEGCEPDSEWLEAAKEAQMRGEEACVSKAWTVQRPASISEEMGRKKKVVAPAPAPAPAPAKGTILQSFPRVRKIYDESEKAPETFHADKCKIWKEERDGRAVWVSAAGHVFDCDSTGEPGEFIRREEPVSK
jgi:hypothetical protein